MEQIDFLVNADNVYETLNYIVKQKLVLLNKNNGFEIVTSIDTFYFKTTKREKQYQKLVYKHKAVRGFRVYSDLNTRKYVL